MIKDIADLIVELSKERTEINDPCRRIYSVYREIAYEIGKQMDKIRKEIKNEKE